jgi:hypothetical protein
MLENKFVTIENVNDTKPIIIVESIEKQVDEQQNSKCSKLRYIITRMAGDNIEEKNKYFPYIKEFWKTLSNIFFILLPLIFIKNWINTNLIVLNSLLILSGLCSAFHHATHYKMCVCNKEITWTLIIDWLPILTSSIYIISTGVIVHFHLLTFVCLALSLIWLFIDNYFSPFKHIGHCLWHIFIAFSINLGYINYYNYIKS